MKIIKLRKVFFIISLSLILLGIGFGLVKGFNFGIDFTGGTMITVPTGKLISSDKIRDSLKEFNLDLIIQHSGKDDSEVIIKTKESIDASKREEMRKVLVEKFSLPKDLQITGEQFGPNIGKEISQKAITSIILASAGMLIYIWIRFKLVYGIAAITSLIHNILIVLGIYAILQIQVNSNFIAAMLTIVGYSINDTIVIFDRIRDNERILRKRKDINLVVGTSIEESLSRTFITSLTTFVVIFLLYFLGVPTMKDFAFPIMCGIIIGTYSSICIAGPIWLEIKLRFKK